MDTAGHRRTPPDTADDEPCEACVGLVGASVHIPPHGALESWFVESDGQDRLRCSDCHFVWRMGLSGWARCLD